MAWVIDLDGVMWLADEPIPGSAEAVARLRAAGERIAFATNNSYATRAEVAAKLAACGADVDVDEVVTSAMAAAHLVEPGERAIVCAGPGALDELERRGVEVVPSGPADVVVVGLDPAFDYERMTTAALAVRDGARLVATNDDATYPTPRGQLPGGGAILASIEKATGTRAMVAGKPHQPICELVRTLLGPRGTVVGDRPETDGAFARALGYRFGLVLSGVSGTGDVERVEPAPDAVAEDLVRLVEAELSKDETTRGGRN